MFHATLKFSMLGIFDQVWGTTLSLFKDFWYHPEIWWDGAQWHESDCCLNWPCSANFARSMEHWNFQNRLGPGPRDDVTALIFKGFQLSAWNLVGRCIAWWSRSLYKMAMLGEFLRVLWNLENFHDRLGLGRLNWGKHITAWNLVAWRSLPWSGSLYEMVTLS